MNKKLEQARENYLEKLKKVKLVEAGIEYSDADIYAKYVTADKPEEIEKEANEIVADVKKQNTAVTDTHHDKRVWNPFGE